MTEEGVYLQYGCGLSVGEGWRNFDNSMTLRLSRVPGLAPLVRLAGGVRFPDEVLYGDVCAGPLAPPGSCAGIYASHVLEHLTLEDFRTALANTFVMLRPGGVFRLIVPDLEALARVYTELLDQNTDTANNDFLLGACLGEVSRPSGLVGRLRDIFSSNKHRWMWDWPSMKRELAAAGFVDIRRCDYLDSGDPMFAAVEDEGRFVDPESGHRCLAVECRRPA